MISNDCLLFAGNRLVGCILFYTMLNKENSIFTGLKVCVDLNIFVLIFVTLLKEILLWNG